MPVSGEPLNPHARELLVRWGDRKEVMSALAATFGSGSWWGPESGWLKGKIEKAKPTELPFGIRLMVGHRVREIRVSSRRVRARA